MRFSKMQGVGNDFVVLDESAIPAGADLNDLAVRLCGRHFGVGADGLLVVGRDAPGAALSMRMFNPDGTEDMCGNGLRCAALWAHRAGWVAAQSPFVVATKEGPRRAEILGVSAEGRAAAIRVDMGQPQFAPEAVPFADLGRDQVAGYALPIAGRRCEITSVNTGSTHTVIFGPPPSEDDFQTVSPALETHPLFPERTSVLWATPQEPGVFAVRIWERGVGETLGCGTGACAVGVAAQTLGLIAPGSSVAVVSRGGSLEIAWPGPGQAVTMTGPAQFVFEGETPLG